MTVTAPDEATLPAALDALYGAVTGLVDDQKQLIGAQILAAPSLYDQLVGEIPASATAYSGRFNGASRPPCWVDALDLRNVIDVRVREWLPAESTTPGRLRALASARWRPQDTRRVRDYANEIQGWAVSIHSLLVPEHVKQVAAACPSCGARWHYRKLAGETVRTPALQLVAATGCSCLSCRAFWSPDKYLWLAKLLQFAPPAGVLA